MEPIAFLPGAAGSAGFWQPVADLMSPGAQVSRWSWPGAGDEPHDPELNSYSDLTQRVAGALPATTNVVAQSMGGAIALAIAVAHPGKIRRLVLVATSGGIDMSGHGARNWRPAYQAAFPTAAPWVTHPAPPLAPEQLRTLTAPTLLIWGDADSISPVSVGRRLSQLLPNSRLHILPGGTHSMAIERPAEVAALVLKHLQ